MRYHLPDGCDRVTHCGVALDKASDGTVEADVEAAEHLAPHGIVPAEEARDVEPRGASSADKRGKP